MLGLPDTMMRGAEHGFSVTKRYAARLTVLLLYHSGLVECWEVDDAPKKGLEVSVN